MKRHYEIFDELQSVIQHALTPYRDQKCDIATLTSAILLCFSNKFGGCNVYFPKQYNPEKKDRNSAIVYAAKAGMPMNRLSQHFNLSRSMIYNILRTHNLQATNVE